MTGSLSICILSSRKYRVSRKYIGYLSKSHGVLFTDRSCRRLSDSFFTIMIFKSAGDKLISMGDWGMLGKVSVRV